MKRNLSEEDIEILSKRIQVLMDAAGLELPGFAAITTVSESHVYALLNKRRRLTKEVAELIGQKFNSSWELLYNIGNNIEAVVRNSESLKIFKLENSSNSNYFTSTRKERKLSYYIEFEIIPTHLFDTPKYVWKVNEFCKNKKGDKLKSDTLKKALRYLSVQKKLKSKKMPIKLRNGAFGTRMVDVFYK